MSHGNLFIDNLLSYNSDTIALQDSIESTSYKELNRRIVNMQKELHQLGISKNQIVFLHAEKNIGVLVTYLALMHMGAIPIFIFERISEEELHSLMRNHPDWVLSNFKFNLSSKYKLTETLIDLACYERKEKNTDRAKQLGDLEVAFALHTSGTTKEPKIYLFSKEELYNRVHSELDLLELKSDDHIFNMLTLSHDVGLNQVLSGLFVKAKITLHNYILNSFMIEQITTQSCTTVNGVPIFWRQLLRSNCSLNKSNLRILTISAGHMSEEEILKLRKRIPEDTIIVKTYGQTETFRSLALRLSPGEASSATGRPVKGVNVSLTDGLLIHEGIGSYSAYLDQGSLIRRTCNSINTHDQFVEKDGDYYFLGRTDTLIKHKGLLINTTNDEEKLKELTNTDIKIFSIKDRYICIYEATSPDDAINSTIRTYIAKGPHPLDNIIQVSKFPRTSVGKIHLKELEKLVKQRTTDED